VFLFLEIQLIVDNCIGFYIVDELKEEIVMMRVLYSRQKYQDII
jgi:hypothetical protein